MVDKNLGGKASSYELMARIYMYAASFYFLSNQYAKARYYVAKGNALANKINYDLAQVHNLELSYKIDSAQGNFRSAFNHLIQYKQKTDSVSSEGKVRQFQVMNVEYEIEMKEDSIKLKDKDISFLRQQTNLQRANLQQAGLIKNLSIAGAILLMILLGLIYNRYRQKQKTNRLLQSQKDVIDKSNHELQQLNEQQTKLLVEKDWLVKEIHHRVKNNLQMVVSLLNAQAEFLEHPSALNAIKESRERMQAIAILHQKLYQLENTTRINMRYYINELVDNIKDSFADTKRISFRLDVDDVGLDISQSVPLGLILNETITNAVKYAYPKNEDGWIQISLKHHDTDRLQLKVADNGKGLPEGIAAGQSTTLGLQLIKLFSEQLEGELCFVNNNGLEITLNFKTSEISNLPRMVIGK
jgi:two-component sensor histidine kinase